jgi:hypothetical protein
VKNTNKGWNFEFSDGMSLKVYRVHTRALAVGKKRLKAIIVNVNTVKWQKK